MPGLGEQSQQMTLLNTLCASAVSKCPTHHFPLGGGANIHSSYSPGERGLEGEQAPCPITPVSQAVSSGAPTQTQACGHAEPPRPRLGANHLQGQQGLPLVLPQFLLLQFKSASPSLWKGRS